MNKFYITTPIYYVNDKPHIGHAYTSLAADVLARFYRLKGADVFFLTGTDEHGQKVERAAQNNNMKPQDFTDKVSTNFRDLLGVMNFSPDDFIRTTEARHKKACQYLWQRLVDGGHIYKGSYEGFYAVRDEAYYQEEELTKNKDGQYIAPSGAEAIWVKEESYFFRLSQFQEQLLAYYHQHPTFIAPKIRANEVISFVKGGLRDISISRTNFSWGVAVPCDDAHVMYVWIDALTNYLTAVGYPDGKDFTRWWPADIHLVGKDIVRFHAVYWPAMLMALGLPLPSCVFAHGWWTNEGQKISKSLGNVIDPLDLVARFGRDQTRYFLLRQVPFGEDGDFSAAMMLKRCNHDLANDLGNLAQRTLSFLQKHLAGRFPAKGQVGPEGLALLALSKNLLPEVEEQLGKVAFHRALEKIWAVVGAANRFIDKSAPWTLAKTDKAAMESTLWVIIMVLKDVGIMLQCFMPTAAEQLLTQLGVVQKDIEAVGRDYQPKAPLPVPTAIFPRLNEE
ncbi:MAG: methionine--tRNA ligase [Alphaproteobacteria bacterium]|nr:methionine--tRNA ligase [Alphaproteobacteria bacterium]